MSKKCKRNECPPDSSSDSDNSEDGRRIYLSSDEEGEKEEIKYVDWLTDFRDASDTAFMEYFSDVPRLSFGSTMRDFCFFLQKWEEDNPMPS